ncbi:MAG: hypothetical protein WC388_02630 [Bacteroidales bacterium]|jgi:hypothetical protein
MLKISTKEGLFDDLLRRTVWFLKQDILELDIDGERVKGYRSPDCKAIWIRDHSDMLRLGKHIEPDVRSTVDHFAQTQAANGRIFDFVTCFPGSPGERENWTKYVRVPVEADVEYRFIKASFLAWQATGDDQWILDLMPALEKALTYSLGHPLRIDHESGLIKRPYTIDTWDFAYTAGHHPWLQFQMDENTFWGIFHGDNSGIYEALSLLEIIKNATETTLQGNWPVAKILTKKEEIRKAVDRLCWNGSFYTHFVKLVPVEIAGVNESEQLSLSNPMAINRGMASHDQAVSILREYIRREEQGGSFAGWYSIDPPFPAGIFGDEKLVPGAYINGGIFPLAGGELALAAFEHGFETTGVSILKKYYDLIAAHNESFLWYFPDGTPSSIETSTSPDAMPTDGWGSSAMAWALLEGLAGIQDLGKLYKKTRLSPRWLAANINQATVEVGYEASGNCIGYEYTRIDNQLIFNIFGSTETNCHILIDPSDQVSEVLVEKDQIAFTLEWIEQSHYLNFSLKTKDLTRIRVNFIK